MRSQKWQVVGVQSSDAFSQEIAVRKFDCSVNCRPWNDIVLALSFVISDVSWSFVSERRRARELR